MLQLNEASTLGKQIVPVMLDDVTWPPEGVLEWLLSDCLLIKLFAETESETRTVWSSGKMEALLMRIAYTVAPEGSKICQGELRRSVSSALPVYIIHSLTCSYYF